MISAIKVIRESELAGQANVSTTTVRPAEDVYAPGPAFLPSHSFPPAPSASFVFPAIRIIEGRNVLVRPESDLPIIEDGIVFPDNFDFDRHVSYEVRHELLDLSNDHARARFLGKFPAEAQAGTRGIVLTSWKWENWAHFITEVLPKLMVADSCPELSNLPLIIGNRGLHQARALLNIFNTTARPIVEIDAPHRFNEAIFISSVAESPYEFSYKAAYPEIRPSDFRFSRWALSLVRDYAGAYGKTQKAPRSLRNSDRFYMKRRSGPRNLTNAGEVEAFFARAGWSIVDPIDLSPAEQISIFSRAKCLAGPVGAAFANMAFCPPGCTVIALYMANAHAPYHYFSNLAHALGHRFHYIGGNAAPLNSVHPAHRHYSLPLSLLSAAYKELCHT